MKLMLQQLGNDRLHIADIAQQVYVSERQLQRIFAEQGDSFRQLLWKLRMHKAKQLLSETEQPVADIAAKVGYRQPSHFAKAFRRAYEVTPAQFRAQQ